MKHYLTPSKLIKCFTKSKKILQYSTDSVKLISNKFDEFNNQIQSFVKAVKEIKDENKIRNWKIN